LLYHEFIAGGYDGAHSVRYEELPVERKESNRKGIEETKQSRWGFRGMTVRDWLELLIVPMVLVIIGFLFTMQQNARQQAIEDQRAERQREVEEQRAQDLTLQAYLDQMSTLVLEDLGDPKVRTLTRARTLTVLRRLTPSRKEEVMQFLLEADLVNGADERVPVIELNGANLGGTDLSDANLSGANLSNANLSNSVLLKADLSNADLREADLSNASLWDASLYDAQLSNSVLQKADLSNANLREADLSFAALDLADLVGTNLICADLSGANLREADLTSANLRHVKGLMKASSSLSGVTMPNGQTYEGWHQVKESRGESWEDACPS
jgi:uncharacterized protein YjbI with pentapeptide repeats